MSRLRDLFGSGNDASVIALEREFSRMERRWDDLTRGLKQIFMPDSYKTAVEDIEYGFERSGTIYMPVPFMRDAGDRHGRKWRRMLESAAERFVLEEDEGGVSAVEEEIRYDFYQSALDHGVPEDVADVFKMKFKKNYRGVQMCRWVHGGSENPRELHKGKWNGHSGKVNGKPNGLDGYVFPLDKPPVIGKDRSGREIRGFPGDLPNCSCLLVPVFV